MRLLLPLSWKRIVAYDRGMKRKLVEMNTGSYGTLLELNAEEEEEPREV